MQLEDALKIISKVSANECTPAITNQFAKICIQIAVSYLRLLERKGKHIRETTDAREFESIAADSIADLFLGDEDNQLRYFHDFFNHLEVAPLPEADLFIALRRLIFKRVQQHLTKIYAQRDPEGAKLFRNVRLSVRRHVNLSLSRDSSGNYILYLDSSGDGTIARPTSDKVHEAFSAVFNATSTVDVLVKETFLELNEKYHSSIEIAISEFVKLIRFFRQASSSQPNIFHDSKILMSLHDADIQKELNSLLFAIREKIEKKYVAQQKLTMKQGRAMMLAIEEMARDAIEGERLADNFDYLTRFWNGLAKEEYYRSVRKIFEYLVRLFKDGIRDFVLGNSE